MGVRTQLLSINNKLEDEKSYGNTWFVDSVNGDDDYNGNDWSHAMATLAAAVATATAGDRIFVSGEPTEVATVTISKQLTIEGLNPDNNVYPTMFYNTGDYPILTIKANNVVIRNIGFVQNHANPAIQIGDTAGQAYYKLVIEGCKIDCWGTGTYGIASGDTAEAPDIVIKNNLFRSFATAAILSNWTRAIIKNNQFLVPTAKTAIVHTPNTADRPDTRILDNFFGTTDSTNAIGITCSGTPTAGMLLVDGNRFVNFADDDHCCSKRTGYMGLNYAGVTAVTITT